MGKVAPGLWQEIPRAACPRGGSRQGELLAFWFLGGLLGFDGDGLPVGDHAFEVECGGLLDVGEGLLLGAAPGMATGEPRDPNVGFPSSGSSRTRIL